MIQYIAMIAVDPNTGLPNLALRGQTGQFVQSGTTTPIPIWEDEAKTLAIVSSNLTITGDCFVPPFWAETLEWGEWYDGTNRVPVWSPQGLTNAALAAQVAAEAAAADAAAGAAAALEDAKDAAVAAQAAAEAAADTLAASPAVLPAGGSPGNVLYRDAAERTGVWGPAPVGTGGTSLTDYSQVTSLPGFPAGGYAPASHTHLIDNLRKSSGTLATFVLSFLSANDAATARGLLGAGTGNGTSNVTVGGSLTGAAMAADKAFKANEIALSVGIAGVTSTSVQGVLTELAGRPTGGTGGGYPWHLDYNFTTSAWPTRPTDPPAGWALVWRGPSLPPVGGLYAIAGLDEFERKDS